MSTAVAGDYLNQGGVGFHGLVICIGNGLLLLTICNDKSLRNRKEMIIIAVRAGADFIYGLAAFCTAIYRIPLMIQGVHNDPNTVMSCMAIPPIPLIYIGLVLTTVMNLVVSIDRYIAVAYAAAYRSYGVEYAMKVLLVVLISILIVLASMFASIIFFPAQLPKINRMCLTTPFPRWYTVTFCTAIPVIGFLSVVVYIGVFVSYRKFINQQPTSQMARNQNAAQGRLTVTLGIIMTSTLVFFVLPYAVIGATYWFAISLSFPQIIFLTTMSRANTLVSLVVYVIRQKEIRRGMWNLLMCKKDNGRSVNVSNISRTRAQISALQNGSMISAHK